MSNRDLQDEFSEPVLTNTPAWWATFDVPGVNVVRDDVCSIVDAFDEFLPWEVRKVRLYDNEAFEPTDIYALKRTDNGRILSGGVTESYGIVNNSDVRDLMDAALRDTPYCVTSVGGLLGGSMTFASVRLDEVGGEINIHGQTLHPLLAVVNGFDGSSSLKVVNTVIRPECLNTIDAAFSQGAKVGNYLRHTRNVMDRVPDLQDAIRTFVTVMDDFQREVAAMIEAEVTIEQAEQVIRKASPIPAPKWKDGVVSNKAAITRAEDLREAYMTLYSEDDRVAPWNGTKWGLFQTFSTYAQNEKGIRVSATGSKSKGERKLVKLFDGGIAAQDRQVKQMIDTLIPA